MRIAFQMMSGAALFVAATGTADAAVVVQTFPAAGATNYGSWVDVASGQNFLVRFTLGQMTTINGFNILGIGSAPVGTAVQIKIRADSSGTPAATNLFSFADTVDQRTVFNGSVSQITSNFAGVTLAAGTYWMGMSGVTADLGWSSYNIRGTLTPSDQYQLQGDLAQLRPSFYDLAYQVLGDAVGVPEPASWAMMILGMGAVGGMMRRRDKISTAVKFV